MDFHTIHATEQLIAFGVPIDRFCSQTDHGITAELTMGLNLEFPIRLLAHDQRGPFRDAISFPQSGKTLCQSAFRLDASRHHRRRADILVQCPPDLSLLIPEGWSG
jgi:hypothetical protein